MTNKEILFHGYAVKQLILIKEMYTFSFVSFLHVFQVKNILECPETISGFLLKMCCTQSVFTLRSL